TKPAPRSRLSTMTNSLYANSRSWCAEAAPSKASRRSMCTLQNVRTMHTCLNGAARLAIPTPNAISIAAPCTRKGGKSPCTSRWQRARYRTRCQPRRRLTTRVVAPSKVQVQQTDNHPSLSQPQFTIHIPIPTWHVRFLDIEGAARPVGRPGQDSAPTAGGGADSSESETEIGAEEAVTTEKFLLLIDQLSVDQKRHLTIKDIGIILERLSSKILDVERLDRESESEDCYNWTIKATIRGDVLRELGVIYNGNYYAISEHPGYKEESDDGGANEGHDEDEDDRI
ncbi:unnamed protein product, partial [Nesidiocoris tenuis]